MAPSSTPPEDPPRNGGRRGRPARPELAEQRRQQIVRAAYQVLTAKGFEQTSMSDIAREAAIGQGTMYRYFRSKRELLDHVFDYAVMKTVERLDLASLDATDVTDYRTAVTLIERFGWRMFAMVDDDPRILRMITVESSAIDHELRYRVMGMLTAVDAAMALVFESVNPEWVSTAEPAVKRLVGRLALAMAGPGLMMSLRGDTDPAHRTTCLSTVAAIAEGGLLAEQTNRGIRSAAP